jgi:branched-chain amino acid transport system ATP-binding protein
MLLELRRLSVSYDTAEVLHGISLQVDTGETVTLIGANGAGKTSCLRAVSGLVPLSSGEVWFSGERIDTVTPRRRVEMGLVQVPEGKRLFPRMTVRENLEMGAFLRNDPAAVQSDLDAMFERFPILNARQKQHAGSLSGGEQQILAFARGLMARPRLLLVDEPSVGLSPIMVKELSKALRAIHQDGTAILLVEQNAAMALRLASRGYLLETGQCVADGPTTELLANDYVRKAYLGV